MLIGGLIGGLVRGGVSVLEGVFGSGTRQVATEVTTGAASGAATGYPSEIAGYKVSEHLFDRMAEDVGHRIPSQVVEQVIRYGQTLPAREPGLVLKYLPNVHEKGVWVLLEETTQEIIMTRVGKP